MGRCKMDKPERADYLRIFVLDLLNDEHYETLDRSEFGSAMLLVFQCWAKKASLPDDEQKLATFAKCSVKALRELRQKWGKIVPLKDLDPNGAEDRVTIPYVWREWQQVMGFYEAQGSRSAKGVEARKAKKQEPMGQPMDDENPFRDEPGGQPMGIPMGIPNKDQDKDQDKEVPPGPQGGTAKAPRRPRRSRVEILEPFGPEVVRVVNTLLDEWRKEDPKDGREIKPSPEDAGKAVDSILKSQPNVTGDILIQAARNYLASQRDRYKAPQYFFGPEGQWDGFVKAILTAMPAEVPLAS